MRSLTLMLCLWPAMAGAQEGQWSPLTGGEIRAALTDRTLRYASGWQAFRSSGRTRYHAGTDSWGYRPVQGDRYCCQWPPSDLWACYGMARSEERLRFVGEGGDVTEGVYAD